MVSRGLSTDLRTVNQDVSPLHDLQHRSYAEVEVLRAAHRQSNRRMVYGTDRAIRSRIRPGGPSRFPSTKAFYFGRSRPHPILAAGGPSELPLLPIKGESPNRCGYPSQTWCYTTLAGSDQRQAICSQSRDPVLKISTPLHSPQLRNRTARVPTDTSALQRHVGSRCSTGNSEFKHMTILGMHTFHGGFSS